MNSGLLPPLTPETLKNKDSVAGGNGHEVVSAPLTV